MMGDLDTKLGNDNTSRDEQHGQRKFKSEKRVALEEPLLAFGSLLLRYSG